ncbi:anhydro-N-acetylmuramic acid kinase [Stenomitos frigidus]|uniref:Anhydro-N-acetylmuramic acid kinase n=1 Tax=Stenomitos frigidus ULC18 TaxID=2107698 RepID=A0A2T1ENQ2_9CYAN|nr:anhydro-N-acetylmuramic acid kinase [Stenomitos frigidus]PSB34351.1 anhydro-N-acetylmuramic acid kinase [Stenomitos frigidus ULC18]
MLAIGLISGTSVDGIDAALVHIFGSTTDLTIELLAGATYPYPPALREQILAVCGGAPLSMADLADLDDAIAVQFAQAAIAIQQGHPTADLIGSHGQTVYHRPPKEERREERGERGEQEQQGEQRETAFISDPLPHIPHPTPHPLGYSLQLGRGAAIAQATGITTISNFRAADIAAGGQGAPLVPAVDVALLSHPTYSRCVQNIGGIGNVAYLPASGQRSAVSSQQSAVSGQQQLKTQNSKLSSSLLTPLPSPLSPFPLGWDTGPGNVLLDLAVQAFSNGTKTYDRDGAWAASGTPCTELVDQWLQQPFFRQPPPKSTGRELFGAAYLEQCLADASDRSLSPADVLATLTELTVASIAQTYRDFLPQPPDQVLLCGGGSKNLYLKERLQQRLDSIPVLTTDAVGLNADFKEAIAFAVLAYWRQQGIPGNLPAVTGAAGAVLLGEINQVSGLGA